MNLEAWADIYIQQLREFHRLLKTDSRVKAGLVYTMGQFGWWSFEISDHWRQFAPLFAEMANEEVVVPEQRIRVLMEDGSIANMAMEGYLRGVVPSEVFPDWPKESLKAQAVAARSYALAATKHPRHAASGADVCTFEHCQRFDPDRIRQSTDDAITATAGQVILYDDNPVAAYFSANCGGATVSNVDGFGSDTPQPYLVGVECVNKGKKNGHGVGMCQWGAHDMAEQGVDYVTILQHYYTGVTVGIL
jgi:peptidoglycan hydrolase-like amidase